MKILAVVCCSIVGNTVVVLKTWVESRSQSVLSIEAAGRSSLTGAISVELGGIVISSTALEVSRAIEG